MSHMAISRPSTHQSRTGVLPRIEHPLSRLQNPEKISIRGVSRASNRSNDFAGEKSYRVASRAGLMSPKRKDLEPKMPIEVIPEGVEVVHSSDPNKPTLPVFGWLTFIVFCYILQHVFSNNM